MSVVAFIERIGWSVGAIRRSVEESAASGTLVSSAAALREAGFAFHHVSAKDGTAYDLARDAVETMRDGLGDIGAIVYATCIPLNSSIGDERRFRDSRDVKHLMDFPVSHLQTDFGLERSTVLGLTQQACTGLLGSLRLARALLVSEPDVRRVLCLTADRFPEGALYEQSYNLITDGAAACIVTLEPGPWRLLAVHQITNGGLARATDEETAGSFFAFTHRAIQETLAKAGLSMKDIAWFVAQNMNRKAMEILARLLRFDPQRIAAPTMAEIAHVISGDNLINLKHMDDRGEIRPGERVLLSMAGYGLNWQCAVLERQ